MQSASSAARLRPESAFLYGDVWREACATLRSHAAPYKLPCWQSHNLSNSC